MRHICLEAASAMNANELCAREALLKPPSLVLHRSCLHASSTPPFDAVLEESDAECGYMLAAHEKCAANWIRTI